MRYIGDRIITRRGFRYVERIAPEPWYIYVARGILLGIILACLLL